MVSALNSLNTTLHKGTSFVDSTLHNPQCTFDDRTIPPPPPDSPDHQIMNKAIDLVKPTGAKTHPKHKNPTRWEYTNIVNMVLSYVRKCTEFDL